MSRTPNEMVQRTGASRFARRQIERQRRLAPIADLALGKNMKRSAHSGAVQERDLAPLTKREAAELRRRYADMMDPTRYVIVSTFSRRFCLYYRPADGDFIMNEITPDTLFKRRSEAVAVARVVEGRKNKGRPGRLQVIAVRKTKRGVRIMETVTDFRHPKEEWKPRLKRKDAQPNARPNEDPRRSLKCEHR